MKPSRKSTVQTSYIQVFNMESLVPERHILRQLDSAISFEKVYEWTAPLYHQSTGRPAVDPVQATKLILLSYLFNHSERDLYETLPMHAGYLWFLGLDFQDIQNPQFSGRKLMDRTTLVKTRKLWRNNGVLDKLMHHVVGQCIKSGLVGKAIHAAVDGTQVRANASIHSLCETTCTPLISLEEYLKQTAAADTKGDGDSDDQDNPPPSSPGGSTDDKKLQENAECEDFHGKKFSNATHRSTTDPDSRLYRKSSGQEAHLRHLVHNLVDTKSRVILATSSSEACGTAERRVSAAQIRDFTASFPQVRIATLSADKAYPTAEFLQQLKNQDIIPLIPQHHWAFEEVPTWKRRASSPERQKNRESLVKGILLRNWARQIQVDGRYSKIQKLRAICEHLYAEAKIAHGMDRARSRGRECMDEQALMTAVVQNLKRLCRFIGRKPRTGIQTCAQQGAGAKVIVNLERILRLIGFDLLYYGNLRRGYGGLSPEF